MEDDFRVESSLRACERMAEIKDALSEEDLCKDVRTLVLGDLKSGNAYRDDYPFTLLLHHASFGIPQDLADRIRNKKKQFGSLVSSNDHDDMTTRFNFIGKIMSGKGFNPREKAILLSFCYIGAPHLCYADRMDISVAEMKWCCKDCPYFNVEHMSAQIYGVVKNAAEVAARDANKSQSAIMTMFRQELPEIYQSFYKEWKKRRAEYEEGGTQE